MALSAKGGAAASGALPQYVQWALDCSPDSLSILDPHLRFLAVNARMVQLCARMGPLVGRSADEIFGSDNAIADMRACVDGQDFCSIIRDVSGQLGQVTMQRWMTESGAVGGLTMRVAPISDERGATPGGEHSGRRLRLAMEMAKVIAFEIDFRSGACILDPAQPTMSQARMHCFDDVMSRVPPSIREESAAGWERHLAGGELLVMEYESTFRNGEPRWYLNASEAIRTIDGEVVGMIGMRQDITDRKHAELAMAEEREAAKAADRAKSEFLANMSHEIRTPLNGVVGVASVLVRTSLDPQQREMVQTIKASGRSLATLLSDVLDFSKIEAGKFELESRPFDPGSVVTHVRNLFAPTAQEKGLTFACEIAPELAGRVTGDSVRLGQILSNLVSNALKFTESGGVSVVGRAEDEGDMRRLVFSVADTGIGLSQDARAKLFGRFVQADGSISRAHGGSGLGLAISRSLARMMGGDIGVQSTPGRGSTFTVDVRLPAASGAGLPGAGEADTAGTVDIDPSARVLLVEDHPVNRRVVELMLGDLVALESASDGSAGVAAFRTHPFDLVLMDMQMPVMNGLEATREIRRVEAQTGARRTPIVMLSANALPQHLAQCEEAGADGHLSKPITLDTLLGAVSRALSSPHRSPSSTAGRRPSSPRLAASV